MNPDDEKEPEEMLCVEAWRPGYQYAIRIPMADKSMVYDLMDLADEYGTHLSNETNHD